MDTDREHDNDLGLQVRLTEGIPKSSTILERHDKVRCAAACPNPQSDRVYFVTKSRLLYIEFGETTPVDVCEVPRALRAVACMASLGNDELVLFAGDSLYYYTAKLFQKIDLGEPSFRFSSGSSCATSRADDRTIYFHDSQTPTIWSLQPVLGMGRNFTINKVLPCDEMPKSLAVSSNGSTLYVSYLSSRLSKYFIAKPQETTVLKSAYEYFNSLHVSNDSKVLFGLTETFQSMPRYFSTESNGNIVRHSKLSQGAVIAPAGERGAVIFDNNTIRMVSDVVALSSQDTNSTSSSIFVSMAISAKSELSIGPSVGLRINDQNPALSVRVVNECVLLPSATASVCTQKWGVVDVELTEAWCFTLFESKLLQVTFRLTETQGPHILKGIDTIHQSEVFALFSVEKSKGCKPYWMEDLALYIQKKECPWSCLVGFVLANRDLLTNHSTPRLLRQNISKLIRWPFAAAADGRWKMDKNMRSLNILETMVKVNPQSRVGFGGQGEVYDGKLTLSNGNVVDVVVKFPIVSTFQVISLDNEIGLTTDLLGSVLLGMFTPYVVKSYGWSTINFLPCIVMEKMEMSVSDFLTRSFTLDVESILLTGLNVSNALETMHSFGLFHRDLTSSNVLFNLAPTIALQKHVTDCKVCDFGFVKNFTASTTPLISKVGKGDWFPPEYFLTTDTVQPSPQVDVFNFGMLICFLMGGRPGTNSAHELHERMRRLALASTSECVMKVPHMDGMEPEIESIVSRCLASKPNMRPAIADVVAVFRKYSHVN